VSDIRTKRVSERALQASSLAFVMLGATAAPALAQTAAPTTAAATDAIATASEVSGVDVRAHRNEPSSPKYTAPLLDTPQTITVVPKEVIRGQNLLSLRDILSTVPGITFGAGEGGGGYGDSINLRGYSANNDITVDGLRDSAQYTRSDPFNLEQLEVINGANSAYSGSGSVGGTINLVSKAPRGSNSTIVSGGFGTDSYLRGTVDSDYLVREGVAVRLNLMAHKNDVPGRDVETSERWGVAPSVTIGLGGPTQLTLQYLHQEDKNTPQYGVAYASNAFLNGPLPGVNSADYFGYQNVDKQDQTVDSLTARIQHDFSDNLSVSNITRYQVVTQDLVVNPPQGTYCLASGFNPQSGAACAAPDTYQPSGPRGNFRNTENTLLVNQTDLTWRFETGALKHTLVTGLSFSHETYDLLTGNVLRNPGGATPNPTLPVMTLSYPDSTWHGPVNPIATSRTDGTMDNRAIYAFDTIEITPQWQLSGGLRFEHNEGESVASGGTVNGNKDDLVSYRVGAVYKPIPNASIYLAYSNSQTPSQASVNGACTPLTPTATAANCDVDPEEAYNVELGGKWDLYDSRLSLTAAIFRNQRDKYRVSSGVPGVPDQQTDGKSRVDGLALGASGLIRPNWSVFANYTYLQSELLQGISSLAIAGGTLDVNKGDPLPNTPEHAFSLWTTYELPEGIQFGYGVTYSGEYAFQRPTGSPRLFYAPDYWVHNLSVTWRATRQTEVQLNVKNLFDEEYYTRIRASNGFGWATPGEARSATITVSHRF
jgi:catecholate siderophore receptor